MKKPVLIIGLLIFVVLILSVIRIFVLNNISTSGVELARTQDKVNKYKFENSIIAEELYLLSSLTNVSKKAYDLGYIDSKSDFVVNKQIPVAIKQ